MSENSGILSHLRVVPRASHSLGYEKLRKTVADAQRGTISLWLFMLLYIIQAYVQEVLGRSIPLGADRLSTLPLELLAEILAYIPARQVASAQTICRSFRDAVKCSSFLQYTIACYADEVVEGLAVTALSTSGARLYRLEQWKYARHKLLLQRLLDEERHGESPYWHLHGRVLVQMNVAKKTIRLTTIPSRFDRTPQVTYDISWDGILPHVHNFWYDSYHDILVISTTRPFHISSLLFLTGTKDKPFERRRLIWNLCKSFGDGWRNPSDVRVRTLGGIHLVYCDFRTARQEVTIVHWKHNSPDEVAPATTIYSEDAYAYPEMPFLETMKFLDPDHLVAVRPACATMPASVVIIPWRKLPRGRDITATEALRYATVFHLPRPVEPLTYRSTVHGSRRCMHLYCEPVPVIDDASRPNTAFRHADGRLPVVVLQLLVAYPHASAEEEAKEDGEGGFHPSDAFLFVVPGSTLMAHTIPPSSPPQEFGGPHTVPWRDWGTDTRVWTRDATHRYLRLWGSRLFWFKQHTTDSQKVIIYDFDSVDSMLRDAGSGDKTRSDQIVVEPSSLHWSSTWCLRDKIVARAPHRRLETEIEVDFSVVDCVHFGEDCFVYHDTKRSRVIGYSI